MTLSFKGRGKKKRKEPIPRSSTFQSFCFSVCINNILFIELFSCEPSLVKLNEGLIMWQVNKLLHHLLNFIFEFKHLL